MIVVDDDSKVRLLLERAFRPPEFETHTFPTGAAALRRVAEIRPECVVSDILMPEMDGETLLRGVRAVPGLERVPFIALSALRSEARIRAVLAAGADAFLLKPFPLRELIEKVRALLERPAAARPAPEKTNGHASPTRPVVAAPHTTSTAAPRRRLPPAARGGPASSPTGRIPAAPPAAPPRSVRLPPVRIAVAPRPAPPARDGEARRVEIGPPDPGVGFGRFTRVEVRGRSFVVLTEAVAAPKFTLTTVVTERGVPLRKIESALPHPLAREEDHDTIRRQLDLQHDDVLRRLEDLVLVASPRRVLWSDQSRSVEAGVLAWAISAVAQFAEAGAGTDETARQLRLTHERALVEDDALRIFHVTPFARVVLDPQHAGRAARRTVRAVAGWCRAFALATLQVEADEIGEPVRQATRRYALELERMGFYDRLLRRAKA
jgi:CheY-like chemotaxis protein